MRLSAQVLTAVEDYGAVSSSLAEQGLKIQPEASGLVYVPMVQQVGLHAADHMRHVWNNSHAMLGVVASSADQVHRLSPDGCGAACAHLYYGLHRRWPPMLLHPNCSPYPSFPVNNTSQEVDDDAFEANEALLERLLAVDDVDAVYTTVAGLE